MVEAIRKVKETLSPPIVTPWNPRSNRGGGGRGRGGYRGRGGRGGGNRKSFNIKSIGILNPTIHLLNFKKEEKEIGTKLVQVGIMENANAHKTAYYTVFKFRIQIPMIQMSDDLLPICPISSLSVL